MAELLNGIIVVDLAKCNYNRNKRALMVSSGYTLNRFPPELLVRSHHTHLQISFKSVQPGDPLWDEDGWDGEQCIYRPVWPQGVTQTIDYMVVHNS